MPKIVRMVDIARKIGVSTVTVSKALADKDGVSDNLRTKIKETAQEMGYKAAVPSHKARTGHTGNIGILVPACFLDDNTNSFYWEMYEKIVRRLSTSDYYGILELLSEEAEQTPALPRMLTDNKIDGMIVIGQIRECYRRLLQEKMLVPMVFLDAYDACGKGYSIISDGYYGMYTVTSYLLAMGHRKISFVGTVNSTSSISDRYFGYCRAMLEHGIEVTPDMVIPDRNQHGDIAFSLPQDLPTAFACNCDLTAYELINQLKARSLRVPDDISVAGFDNFSVPGITTPDITTYAVDMAGMAHACVDALLHQIYHRHQLTGMKIVSGHLVLRSSVKKMGDIPPPANRKTGGCPLPSCNPIAPD